MHSPMVDTRPRLGHGRVGTSLPGRRRRRGPRPSHWWALLFVGPTGLGLGVFYLWPMVRTIMMSFTKAGPFGGYKFIGTANWTHLFADPELLNSLRNTAVYTVIALLSIPISICIALLLNSSGLRGRSFFRSVYFVPVVTMPAAVALVWRMIYNGDYGILNQALRAVGIQGTSWLTNPSTALIAVAVVAIWSGLGLNIVIFLAGLQGIPRSVLEAAEIDGAGPLRRVVSVTIPLLSPSIFFVSVINVIGALQVFDLIFIMIGVNNPAMSSTQTIVFLFYKAAFLTNNRGYAAAIAILLLLIILVLTAIQFALQKRWVHYES